MQLEPPNVEQRREFTRLLLFRLCGGQLDERQPWLEQMGIDGAIDSLVAEHTSNRSVYRGVSFAVDIGRKFRLLISW